MMYLILAMFLILLAFSIVGLICLAAIAVYNAGRYTDDSLKWGELDNTEEED